MIELLDVSNEENVYSSIISLELSGERIRLGFSIDPRDFGNLKRILEFRPFENTRVAKYHYFFSLSYEKKEEGWALAHVRVEQLNRYKQFEFRLTQKYISNLLWFRSMTEKKELQAYRVG